MNERRTQWLASALTAGLMVACAQGPGKPEASGGGGSPTPGAPSAQIAPELTTGSQRFVLCTADGCLKPTPKTMAGLPPVRQAKLTLPAQPTTAVAAVQTDPGAAMSPAQAQATATVRFGFGSASLDAGAKAQLAALLPQLRTAQEAKVVGYTDSVGGKASNAYLAHARAWAVRQELRRLAPELGLTVSVAGEGLCCYVAANDSELGRSTNRRAEIELSPGVTPGSGGEAQLRQRQRPPLPTRSPSAHAVQPS